MFSEKSLQNAEREPGIVLSTSQALSWRSLLFQSVQSPTTVDRYETIATPDQTFTTVLSGTSLIESGSSGTWKSVELRPLVGGSTPPLHVDRLRWRTTSTSPLKTAHLYLPGSLFEEAIEDLAFREGNFPNTHGCIDTVVAHTMQSIHTAVQHGASELYAECAARFLVAHVLLSRSTRSHPPIPSIWDSRVARALALIEDSFGSEITLSRLAKEANMSPYHFLRTFRKHLGVTPYAYLTSKRIERAAARLRSSDAPIRVIASECGYSHLGHFAVAFRRRFGVLPSQFRDRARMRGD